MIILYVYYFDKHIILLFAKNVNTIYKMDFISITNIFYYALP